MRNPPRKNAACSASGHPGTTSPGSRTSGLFAQQHRGQESAGIAVSDGSNILVYKDLGLVSQVFNEATLTTLHGDLAVGHTRYSTTGSTTWENAQPVFKTDGVHSVALGHNGNLVNTRRARRRRSAAGAAPRTDSDLVTTMIATEMPDARRPRRRRDARAADAPGAFCFVFMDERSVYAARDPHGVRPLSIGRLPNGFVVASETCALDIVGATFVRDVEPGEMVRIDDRGLHSHAVRGVARSGALRLRVRLPRAARLADARPITVHEARRRDGPPPRRRSTRSRPTW